MVCVSLGMLCFDTVSATLCLWWWLGGSGLVGVCYNRLVGVFVSGLFG